MRKSLRLFTAIVAVAMLVLTACPALAASYSNWKEVATDMQQVLDNAYALYEGGDAKAALKEVNNAYYNYYEAIGFEGTVKAYISGSRASNVELQFSFAKAAINGGKTNDEVKTEIDKLISMLFEDAKTLDPAEESASGSDIQAEIEKIGTLLAEYKASVDPADEAQTGKIAELESELATLSGMLENYSAEAASEGAAESTGNSAGNSIATFVAAFGIILREGLEAILVIGAIIAYLVKSGNKDKVRIVYIGSVVGIALSFVAAWLLNALKLANQAPQEVIEGVTALIAVVVLFYVSNWMVSKSESAAWTRYIDSKVSASVETGSMFTLGFTAFLAVFREGAEVVLFYQPMLAEGNPSMVWYGFAVGCVVLVAVFLLIRFLSIKIPIKPFFLGTSILMCLMSISFLGSGIKELIEGDVIKTVTPFLTNIIPYNDVMDVLGLYPILQTLLPQFILLVISVVTFIIHNRRNRKIAAEAKARG